MRFQRCNFIFSVLGSFIAQINIQKYYVNLKFGRSVSTSVDGDDVFTSVPSWSDSIAVVMSKRVPGKRFSVFIDDASDMTTLVSCASHVTYWI